MLARLGQATLVAFSCLLIPAVDRAAAAEVVALGASQTYGHGVARGQDYPAQLQAMLRQDGLHVTVLNAGVRNGTTTGAMLARLPGLLAADTRVLILQPGRERGGDDRRGSMLQMEQMAARRGIEVIKIPNSWFKEFPRQAVDHQHLTAEGFHGLASKLLPRVETALR